MKVLFLGNNRLGWQALRCLKEQGEEIVGVVLHPPQRQKYGDCIVETAGLPPDRLVNAAELDSAAVLARLRSFQADMGVSVGLGYILREPLLQLLPGGCINLHTSLLPYNRGANPNVWSIVDRTPAGVTLHYIDRGVDTGDVIGQVEVPVEAVDTGESLYHKLEAAALALFREQWPLVRQGQAVRKPQPAGGGSSHRVRDLERLDAIDPDHFYKARDLIDILRARTFPPYRGAHIVSNGRKVYLRLQLEYEDSDASQGR